MTLPRLQEILAAAKDSANGGHEEVFLGNGPAFTMVTNEEMVEIVSMAITALSFLILPAEEVVALQKRGRELFRLDEP